MGTALEAAVLHAVQVGVHVPGDVTIKVKEMGGSRRGPGDIGERSRCAVEVAA